MIGVLSKANSVVKDSLFSFVLLKTLRLYVHFATDFNRFSCAAALFMLRNKTDRNEQFQLAVQTAGERVNENTI